MKFLLLIICCFIILENVFSQGNPPWERPLKMATSTDGQFFSPPVIFQDSSGVPSLIKWKGDTLACAFQWFRVPMNSSTWDKVAVKFSYDNGLSWTQPTPIVVNGLPFNYQRPFDPTLAVINSDSLRIFFSSSNGMPLPGGDSIIDTYSAVSVDGINYSFESGPRFDNSTSRVIDPAAILFNNQWHYAAPIGAPQDGAYHCTSIDGINFFRQSDYLSDMQHNWTGNFMIYDTNELRFYGSGPQLWYKSSSDGFNYGGYVNTNLMGGDPSVAKIQGNNFIIIFVGEQYLTSVNQPTKNTLKAFPNPVTDIIHIENEKLNNRFSIYNNLGVLVYSGICNDIIDVSRLPEGTYVLSIPFSDEFKRFHFIKTKN